jgi:hypothetical protein
MRLTTGGLYEINGAALRAVTVASAGPDSEREDKARQSELWGEGSTLIHVHRRLSDEELGLWGAIERELDRIQRKLNGYRAAARAANRESVQ